MRYILPGIQLESEYPLDSFRAFISEEHCDLALSVLTVRYASYSFREVLFSVKHKDMHVAALADGWIYFHAGTEDYALHVSRDYRQLTAYVTDMTLYQGKLLPSVRMALECASVGQGVLSLHGSCEELDGQAVCFTASSGTGKSTRVRSWNFHYHVGYGCCGSDSYGGFAALYRFTGSPADRMRLPRKRSGI